MAQRSLPMFSPSKHAHLHSTLLMCSRQKSQNKRDYTRVKYSIIACVCVCVCVCVCMWYWEKNIRIGLTMKESETFFFFTRPLYRITPEVLPLSMLRYIGGKHSEGREWGIKSSWVKMHLAWIPQALACSHYPSCVWFSNASYALVKCSSH